MDNATLIANIEFACRAKGEKVTPACRNAGVGHNFVQNLKKGQKPSIEKIFQLASYLGVTTSELLGENPPSDSGAELPLTALEWEYLSLLRNMSPNELNRLNDFLAGMKASRGD